MTITCLPGFCFWTFNWTETVGLYLKSIRKEGKNCWLPAQCTQDYGFLIRNMNNSYLSRPVTSKDENVLRSPLNNLHQGIFLRMEKMRRCPFIEEKTKALLERALKLRQWYINRVGTYSELCLAIMNNITRNMPGVLLLNDRIGESCTGGLRGFRSSGVGGKLKRVFSGNARAILEARRNRGCRL